MTASQHPADKSLVRFLVGSTVVHLLALVVWGIISATSGPKFSPDVVVKTKLVKLGKKRDDKLLPRRAKPKKPPKQKKAPERKKPEVKPPEPKKAEAVPPKPEAKKAIPQQPSEPEPPPEPKKSAADLLADFEDEEDKPNPNDILKNFEDEEDEDDEGNPEGSKIGKELSGRFRAEYNDKVKALVRSNLNAPSTLTDSERIRLEAGLVLHIAADGSVASSRISSSSGNAQFDNAVLRAGKTAKFPAPPVTERAFYQNGVVMTVCPIRCQ